MKTDSRSRQTTKNAQVVPRLRSRALGPALALVMILATGCAPTANLRPAPGADDVAWLSQAAIDEVGHVRVVAQTDAWDGDPDIMQHVTPVRLMIENDHDAAIRVRYQDVALIASDGTRYPALPPLEVEGTVSERLVVKRDVIGDPAFVYDGYVVAGYAHGAYPEMVSYGGPFMHDVDYYDHYHEFWIDRSLPTPQMLSRALPEGVLEPSGEVEGFFYFPAVDHDHARVRLRVDVAEATNGKTLGEISVPFVVN